MHIIYLPHNSSNPAFLTSFSNPTPHHTHGHTSNHTPCHTPYLLCNTAATSRCECDILLEASIEGLGWGGLRWSCGRTERTGLQRRSSSKQRRRYGMDY